MRSMWKGIVSFGLVSIPVQLYSATEEHRVPLHQVHAEDGGRIRLRRICEIEGTEVPYRDIARGYESPDGRTVILSDEDLAELPLPSKKTIDVLAFVDATTIDPLMFDNAYYVGTADRTGAKPYVLLRQALEQTGQVAVTKVTLRTRESLAVLRVHDDVLVLQTMLWPDEVRSAEEVAPQESVEVRRQELKMALSLMETLSEGFDLNELKDDYQHALEQVVEARLEGAPLPREEGEAPPAAEVIDLMSALRGSVQAARESRAAGEREPDFRPAVGDESAPRRAPRKRAAGGKKAAEAAGKSAARPPQTKKTAPRKAAQAPAEREPASRKPAARKAAKKTAAKKSAAKKTTSRRRAS